MLLKHWANGFVIWACYLLAVKATRPVEPSAEHDHDLHPASASEWLKVSESTSLIVAEKSTAERCCCRSDVTLLDCKRWRMYRGWRPHWYHRSTKECCWTAKWPGCWPTFAFLLFSDQNGGSKADDAATSCPADVAPVKPESWMHAHFGARTNAKYNINGAFIGKAVSLTVAHSYGVATATSVGHPKVMVKPITVVNQMCKARGKLLAVCAAAKTLKGLEHRHSTRSTVSLPTMVSSDNSKLTLSYDNLNEDGVVLEEGETICSEITFEEPEELDEDGETIKKWKAIPVGAVCVANQDGEIDAAGNFELNETEAEKQDEEAKE